ncbi:hypothetical protein PGUG_04174 [Meyerozyma guilliermondii ATCC 6260]|uniref:C2H2-type domain-containing protein n=1 Tax=Meyerozyma guilliermondii (strain ATCC 6260 / CBS 566 / DSM 6381 / JCM 1539 / NBRC 10279 / NRRL Y-324) TaxID=294746 RepID=A5DLM3_PICGU|nr:uncharacterized protein PGUG_04174 [Meyerozyma guilliermondii ATCC 6260]EDK40076.2 hypothetical protein PGUG_04174 [Meyerozyma guilliermondii ATCC 6260]
MLQIQQFGNGGLNKTSTHSLPSFNELITAIPLPNDFLSSSSPPPHSTTPPSNSTPFPEYYQFQPIRQEIRPKFPISNPPSFDAQYPRRESFSPAPHSPLSSLGSSATTPEDLVVSSAAAAPPVTKRTTKTQVVARDVGVTSRKHICKWCHRSFTTSGHLARHNRIHTGERKHNCPWPSCDAKFARQDNCMQHYKSHTNNKKRKRHTH